ncbi:hypothetical protein TWF481_006410 [Arthrobotrys musiformis]|uniref:Uncharacterized protein n=1 Tax=Arthrobotrys musiformis TaxID=47236 RepID=A0AAV9WHL2_9PEZI
MAAPSSQRPGSSFFSVTKILTERFPQTGVFSQGVKRSRVRCLTPSLTQPPQRRWSEIGHGEAIWADGDPSRKGVPTVFKVGGNSTLFLPIWVEVAFNTAQPEDATGEASPDMTMEMYNASGIKFCCSSSRRTGEDRRLFFGFLTELPVGTFVGPCKAIGSWMFRIKLNHPRGSGYNMRMVRPGDQLDLEFYFVLGEFPSRSFCLDLMRIGYPPIERVAKTFNPDAGSRTEAWSAYVLEQVWGYAGGNLKYPNWRWQVYEGSQKKELMGGASSYWRDEKILFGINGEGAFDLGRFLSRKAPANCFDLSIFTALLLEELGTIRGNSYFINPRIVTFYPFGYVTPGPLFGWVATGESNTDYNRCNSPFWRGDPSYGVPDGKIFYPDAIKTSDPTRTCFSSHTWVEVESTLGGGDWRVIDATQGKSGADGAVVLLKGQNDRDTFLKAGLDAGPRQPNGGPMATPGATAPTDSTLWWTGKVKGCTQDGIISTVYPLFPDLKYRHPLQSFLDFMA